MKLNTTWGCKATAVLLSCFASLNVYAGSDFSISSAVDMNSDPNVFETMIVASETEVELENGKIATVFAYNGQVPGPEIRVKRGDRVIVHLVNELPEGFPTTIHWHGIELNNASDGTMATQHHVMPGETFTYDFIAPRAGVYWYHPHMRSSQSVFAGLYAPLIVTQPEEKRLIKKGKLPKRDLTVVLSDISISDGRVKDVENVTMLETANGTEGDLLLVNGKVLPTVRVVAGQGVRLRLINASIGRYYRLSLPGHDIYRVGGEGGLISKVVLEGGKQTVLRTATDPSYTGPTGLVAISKGYEKGEILLAPGQRADVVIVPRGEVGEVLSLKWMDVKRGRHKMVETPMGMKLGSADDDGTRGSVDLLNLKIYKQTKKRNFSIAEGNCLVDAPDALEAMRTDTRIRLHGDMQAMIRGAPKSSWFKIDDFSGIDGRTNYRVARIGETIEWEVHNATHMHHPFHLHGFSFQPVRFETDHHEHGFIDTWSVNPNNEYIDTLNLAGHTSVFFRFQIDERPDFGDSPGVTGGNGALGDWVFHCHVFQHEENGMMSFLRVE